MNAPTKLTEIMPTVIHFKLDGVDIDTADSPLVQ